MATDAAELTAETVAVDALAARSRIVGSIRDAETALAQAAAAIAAARAGIEDAQSADEPDLAVLRAARGALDAAMDGEEVAKARLAGLRRRLAAIDGALLDHADAVLEQLNAILAAEASRIAGEYAATAEALCTVLAEAKMIGNAVYGIAAGGMLASWPMHGMSEVRLVRDIAARGDALMPDGLNRIAMDAATIAWDGTVPPVLTDATRKVGDLAQLIASIQRQVIATERQAAEAARPAQRFGMGQPV
jgi:hypothetical protein